MIKLTTPFDIFKVLPKSNCGKCQISTCLAFAAAVIKEEKQLSDCTCLDKNILSQFSGRISKQINLESIQEDTLKDLKEKIVKIDLSSRAEKIGARFNGRSLLVKCLGKDFEVDAKGSVVSHCHTHPWFMIPLLHYILFSKGNSPSGRWVPFRELENSMSWNPLFERKCERPLKCIADTQADLFEDLISIFSGMSYGNAFTSDISVILYPLPKLPMMICYWKPEDDMESKLHLFFDDTADKNLLIESIYSTCMGIIRMLENLMQKHSSKTR
ncbi:MAG TPA: DUF3786 domain-containing protein [Nitrospirota bacterium]|nr:DUF3786 domain-containing protein [Nitrospirota bacterium]